MSANHLSNLGRPRSSYKPVMDRRKIRYREDVMVARGIPREVDIAPVQKRIAELRARGMSFSSIARKAGVSSSVVADIVHGRGARTRIRVAQAIMSVTYEPSSKLALMAGIGATRRVRALLAIGYRYSDIDVICGFPASTAKNIGCRPDKSVTYETWKRVADGYDKVSMTPGPSALSASRARAKGWPTPLDWETVDIDDPLAHPPEVVDKPLVVRGTSATKREHMAAAERMFVNGASSKEVAEKLGVSTRSAERWKSEIESKAAA